MSMPQPWRDPRTGIWKLRRRIPQRYRAVAGVKGESIKLSTGTADRDEAKRRWPAVLQKWAALEAAWERQLNCIALTPETAQTVAAQWVAHIAAGHPLDADGIDSDLFEILDRPDDATPERLATLWQRVGLHADAALTLAGLSITADSRPLLLRTMLPAVRAAYLQADLRALGAVGPPRFLRPLSEVAAVLPQVAPAPPPEGPPAATVSLQQLLATWKATAANKPSVVAETEYAVQGLARFLGTDDASAVTRDALIRWRDSLKAAGRSNATWNNRLSLVRQVLLRALRDGRLPADPTEGLRLPRNAPVSWLPYSDGEAARILLAARAETQPARRWAHWIMAFTGMRVGEVLQLSAADLRADDDILYIAVHQDDPEKSVKNNQRRNVPIHPALVQEGLVAYARSLPAGSPLFPDKALDRHGRRGGHGWNLVGAWVREVVGITDPRKAPDHSWRHRMEDELRSADVPEDLRDAILGHARRTMGRIYGVRGESLRRLSQAIDRLKPPPGLVAPTGTHEP